MFVICNFTALYFFNNKGKVAAHLIELKKIHDFVKIELESDLKVQCQFFKNTEMQDKLKKYLEEKNIKYHFSFEKIIKIDEYIFKRVHFNTFYNFGDNLSYSSSGYYIENAVNKKCFALI